MTIDLLMATKPETTFYRSIHKLLPPSLYKLKMHNPYVGGVPDVWYSGPTGDLWVEYKWVVLPKRSETLISAGVSPLQEKWLEDRYREGRSVAVIIGSSEGGVIRYTPHGWSKPLALSEFRYHTMSRQDIAEQIERLTCG